MHEWGVVYLYSFGELSSHPLGGSYFPLPWGQVIDRAVDGEAR